MNFTKLCIGVIALSSIHPAFADKASCKISIDYPTQRAAITSKKFLNSQIKKKGYILTDIQTADKELKVTFSGETPYVTYCYSASCKLFYMGKISYELTDNGTLISSGSNSLDIGISESVYIYDSAERLYRKLVRNVFKNLPKCK